LNSGTAPGATLTDTPKETLMTFKALLITRTGETTTTSLVDYSTDDLMPGDVTVSVAYSTVNYKDGMALSGRSAVVRKFPLIPGIDFAGVVEASSHPGFAVGDRVVANGWELSQTHHGGYAQKARVKGDWLVKIPDAFTTRETMAIGTAGYTAMLAVLALEHGGITPDRGDILVTGASGGSGSVAIALLSKLGYRVIASTGRLDLPGSVLPFILRNVTLAGIDSVNAPQDVRLQAWQRLASDLDVKKLAQTTQEVALADVPRVAKDVVAGRVRGRTVVNVNA
jgi:NADPH:quinone reductase-like Zn-dependent oxidoreductase